jgi:hypothetical protein
MSLLTFRLVLVLVIHLALLLMLCLISLLDLTIAHMVLVQESTALRLDALDTAHVLIVVIISHVGLVFLLKLLTLTLIPDTWTVHVFPHRGSHSTGSSGEVLRTMKTSFGRMVKYGIPKIYLTKSSTEPSTFSHPM